MRGSNEEAYVARTIRIEREGGGPSVEWFGTRLRFPVHAADTGGRLAVQVADVPTVGGASPPHCHGSEDEIFYVLAGCLNIETPRDRVSLVPGDLAIAPRGLPHRIAASEPNTRVLTIITPGALEEAFLRVAADPSPRHLQMEMGVWAVHILEEISSYRHPLAPEPGPLRVVRSCEGDRYWLASDEYTVKISSATLDDRLSVVHFRIPPGGGPVVHTHLVEEEVFYVLRGDVSFYADGSVVQGQAGDTALLPRGIPHCFRNTGVDEAEFLAIVTPAGFDEFVRQAGRPAVAGRSIPGADAAEFDRIKAVSERFGVVLHPEIQW